MRAYLHHVLFHVLASGLEPSFGVEDVGVWAEELDASVDDPWVDTEVGLFFWGADVR